MKDVYCAICKNKVSSDEVAMNVKLLGKQIGLIRCYDCLAAALNWDKSKLIELAEYYKKSGCTIFEKYL